MPHTKKNYIVYASVGDRDLGVFDAWDGGDSDSEGETYREGGGNFVPLGGTQTRDNITITRLFKSERDGPIKEWLESRRGKAEAVFTKQPVDDEENPNAPATIRRGKLKKVTEPPSDSKDSAASTFDLELEPRP